MKTEQKIDVIDTDEFPWGIVLWKDEDDKGMLFIHMALYPDEPNHETAQALIEELMTDEEFEFKDVLVNEDICIQKITGDDLENWLVKLGFEENDRNS